jgi:hypothetical protein
VSSAEERMRERFAEIRGPADGDWADIVRRARPRTNRLVVFGAAAVVALVATGFGLGGRVIGLFRAEGKPVPLSSFSARDRELLVASMCNRLALSGKPPRAVCLKGEPTVEEIARDEHEIHWRIRYPWGVTCIASGPVRGHRIDQLGCNVGASNQKLVPTPRRPITVGLSMAGAKGRSRLRLTRVSGLAGQGVVSVGLVSRGGDVLRAPVRGSSYSFGAIPDRLWAAIVAFDGRGNRVYREALPRSLLALPRGSHQPYTGQVGYARSPKRPAGTPLQHASSQTGSADVWRNGVVAFRFASTTSEAYRRLARRKVAGFTCRQIRYGAAGRWKDLGGGATVLLRPEVRMRMDLVHGGFPSPPYDFCEVQGLYGRYWNDEEGTHEVVEVPFNALARRYLDERATARDLAYFVRTRKMWRIRKAVHRGEPAPSAEAIASLFGPRVVALANRASVPSNQQVGVWTDGHAIVAKERAPDGRLLFVTINGVLIGENNIADLSFTF